MIVRIGINDSNPATSRLISTFQVDVCSPNMFYWMEYSYSNMLRLRDILVSCFWGCSSWICDTIEVLPFLFAGYQSTTKSKIISLEPGVSCSHHHTLGLSSILLKMGHIHISFTAMGFKHTYIISKWWSVNLPPYHIFLEKKGPVPKVAGLDQLDVPPSGESVY